MVMDKLDVIIVGATGFSAKYIVKFLARNNCGLKWGISGRSASKLESLMEEIKSIHAKNSEVPVIYCDVKNKESLSNVCKQTKLLVNCIGPYMETGYDVVEACIKYGTHYIDITLQTNFILDLSRKYQKLAEEAKVLILPATGVVSTVPSMGLMHLEKKFSGTLRSVESYTKLDLPKEVLYPNSKNSMLNGTTLLTFLERVKYKNQLQNLIEESLPEIEQPPEMDKPYIHYSKGNFWLRHVFPDEDIINISQIYLEDKEGRKRIPFRIYMTSNFSWFFLIAIPFFAVVYLLMNFQWGRNLIGKYPRIFTLGYMSNDGPLEEVGKKIKYTMTLTGKGWSSDVKDYSKPVNKLMKLEVKAYDLYEMTAIAVVASVLIVLDEPSKMPRGGVINSAAAFRRTDIVKKLVEFGITYDVIEEKIITH